METRKFPNINARPSLLGFGGMRMPTINNDSAEIDFASASAMVDAAFASGITYFDTAYPYHEGTSETFFGQALKKYPRESFLLATKMPIWKLEKAEDIETIFNEQLKNCQTDYFDFYLLHALGAERFEKAEAMNVYEALLQKKREEKIRHLGFSFHDTPDVLEKICSAHIWDFAQIQLNYLDWEMQKANEQYAILEKHNIPCIVMEPVRGGALASLCPESDALLHGFSPDNSIASWAIRWAAGHSNVMTVLSGMSTMEQLKDNVNTMSPFVSLSEKEHTVLADALKIYHENRLIPCTGCRYCMDCLFGVDIPAVFKAYNGYKVTKDKADFLSDLSDLPATAQPSHCVACGKCKSVCPQHIDVPALMAEIAAL